MLSYDYSPPCCSFFFSFRILSIYKESYGEYDGRFGMALCSVAHVKCATGNYVILSFSPFHTLKDTSMMVDFKPPALQQFTIDKYNIILVNSTAATFPNLSVKST